MKTTLDLPDDLLIEAKAVAARRRTTLREMVTRSLRREIGQEEPLPSESAFELGSLGLPVLKKGTQKMTAKQYRAMVEKIEDEEFGTR